MCAMCSDRVESKARALMAVLDFGAPSGGDDTTISGAGTAHLKPAQPLELMAELQRLLLVPVVC